MISNNQKYVIVDAGNTQIKIVDFERNEIVQNQAFDYSQKDKIQEVLTEIKNVKSIFSSVLSKENNLKLLNFFQPDIILNAQTKLPISLSGYHSSQTLGTDRIANAVAAHHFSETANALVIDLGSCMTFDFVEKGIFQGGSISPGLKMRLRAMSEFTGTLPMLKPEKQEEFIGKSTKEAMLSGVFHGIQAEIINFADLYKQKYAPLTIFLTGGDYKMFENSLKNDIFADKNLTVKGLYLILLHNV